MTDPGARLISCIGFASMIAIAFLCSRERRRIAWVTVAWGVGLQLALGVLLLKTPLGRLFFDLMNIVANALTTYTDVGVRFVFGALAETGFSFIINVLPIIIFMGSVFAVLYHLGLVQRLVTLLAVLLSRTMKISGVESLAAVANLFLGMVESALMVRPYLERMTRSELFTLMTLGMATVAGSVMLAYVGMLGGGDYAGHLATASLLSAPAGILIAKMMVPETATPETSSLESPVERTSVNLMDAAAQGALAGLRLAAYVGAMLLAFVALIALVNDMLGSLGSLVGIADLTMERVLGLVLAPIAFLLGVPWQDATTVGGLLGIKTVLNEFIAYQQLSELIEAGQLTERSAVITSYALCGFANFGSLAILLGSISGIAPSRRGEVAELGLRCILSGTLATFMTACVVGVLL